MGKSPSSPSPPPQQSAPPCDTDILLPDAPPVKTEDEDEDEVMEEEDEEEKEERKEEEEETGEPQQQQRQEGHGAKVDLDKIFDADSGDGDALNFASSAAVPVSSSPPRPPAEPSSSSNQLPASSSASSSSSSSLPASSATSPLDGTDKSQSGVATTTTTTTDENYSDPQIMLQFYSRLFPFRTLFHWLNHSLKPGPDFGDREFAFTLSNDAYLRYQSYASADLLRRDILRLIPSRFEIGPVYTANPRDRKTLRRSTAFRPRAKEVVFDIDLTDYDDVRTCCDRANICRRCWRFVSMAIKVIDVALRDDFGFQHVMWVYSGRRGAHAWVSDRAAREMDDDRRKAMAAYLEVIKGGAQGGKRVQVKRPLHPHLTRSLDLLKPYFQSAVLEDQNPFATAAGAERLLTLLPQDPTFLTALRTKWSATETTTTTITTTTAATTNNNNNHNNNRRPSTKKWSDLDAIAATGISKTLDARALRDAKQDIVLEYTYPRLDVEVSKKRIHLLKSPFVVHPATGRVCVPITTEPAATHPHLVDDFDPLAVPTVTRLLAQVDGYHRDSVVTTTTTSAGASSSSVVPASNQATSGNGANGNGNNDDIMHGFVADGSSASGRVRKILDWEKTELKVYVERFDGFVRDLLRVEARRNKRELDGGGEDGGSGNGDEGKRRGKGKGRLDGGMEF